MTHLTKTKHGHEEQREKGPGEKAAIDVEIGEVGETNGEETGTRGCWVAPTQMGLLRKRRNSKTGTRRSFIVWFFSNVLGRTHEDRDMWSPVVVSCDLKRDERRKKKIENLLTSLCEWYVCFGSFRPCFLL